LTTIATPTGENGTLQIKQNATLSQLILAPKSEITYQIATDRKVYVHQVAGELNIEDQQLKIGDGAKLTDMTTVTLVNPSDTQATALIFDLP
ncbi:hypothetical protein, partial [Psychrobacter sp. CAL346-MNA-CIBAN-0220]